MDFDPNEDQIAVRNAISPLLQKYCRLPDPSPPQNWIYGEALEAELAQGGWFDGDTEALGLFDAGLIVEEIGRLPYALEAMASLVVAPGIGLRGLPRPYALLRKSHAHVPVRFLPMARTAIIDAGDRIEVLDLDGLEIEPVEMMFAAPYGRLPEGALAGARPLGNMSVERLRHLWRLGLAAEISGAMQGALDLTVDYVKQREQFGKPLGALQAIQHRLAEDATLLEGVRLMLRRALWSDNPADAAMATAYAQQGLGQFIYDCQQFHGATGLTLEYVLHHWTFRLKALQGELGGATAQARIAADALWKGPDAA